MTALTLIILAAFVGLWLNETRRHALERRDFLAAFEDERKLWHRERQLLLNRIKPETAQNIAGEMGTSPQPPLWDSDEEWWEAQDMARLTKDELAETLMAEEVNGRP